VAGTENTFVLKQADQGHARSLILVRIGSAYRYATSY